ncbi:MAG: class I SAM-dependent methyltransferase, partial [Thermodesulfobacteriota bacterium]
MERVTEPELMEDMAEARAYAEADFSEPHSHIMKVFEKKFPGVKIKGNILDLGCGPGDITFRFARRFPEAHIIGVDGSAAMIGLAEKRKAGEPDAVERITFVRGRIPGAPIPPRDYGAIVTNSLLHHLPRPMVLWETVVEYAAPGAIIFVADLMRPASVDEARRMVEKYSSEEPEVLKRDFYNSLLAAFSPEEVQEQIREAGLPELKIKKISDRH